MATVQFDLPEETLETDFLDSSLSVWKGTAITCYDDSNDFVPVAIDLHTACSIGCSNVVSNFIRRCASGLDEKNKGGWTPLMYASYIGHDGVVCQLLDAGADVNTVNNKGQTPLSLAASCGNEDVAKHLLERGSDMEVCDRNGWTALYHATYSGHQNVVKLLVDNGANMNVVEPIHGMTALMEAAAAGHEIIVHYFLHCGADVLIKSRTGDTALSLAVFNGHTRIASLINKYIVSLKSAPCNRDITQGPILFAQLIEQAKTQHLPYSVGSQTSVSDAKQLPSAAAPIAAAAATATSSGASATGACCFDIEEDDDEDGFSQIGALTLKTSFGSRGGGLLSAFDSHTTHNTQQQRQQTQRVIHESTEPARQQQQHHHQSQLQHNSSDINTTEAPSTKNPTCSVNQPDNLQLFLSELGLAKYVHVFEEQDVDFPMFLTLTDDNLKEIGIKLFGPRRKMTAAIARWNSTNNANTCQQQLTPSPSQTGDELERVKSQLQKEKQLRAVTEVCLMEDRVSWQQISTVSATVLQSCAVVQTGLADMSECCNELCQKLEVDSLVCKSESSMSTAAVISTRDPSKEDLTRCNVLQLINRMQNTNIELTRNVTNIHSILETLVKRTSTLPH